MRPDLDGDKHKLSKWEMFSKVPTLSVGKAQTQFLFIFLDRGYHKKNICLSLQTHANLRWIGR